MSVLVLTEGVIDTLKYASDNLKGDARRIFMAKVVEILGLGGQRRAERELGWNRGTIRKGQHELENGSMSDNFSARDARKRRNICLACLKILKLLLNPPAKLIRPSKPPGCTRR